MGLIQYPFVGIHILIPILILIVVVIHNNRKYMKDNQHHITDVKEAGNFLLKAFSAAHNEVLLAIDIYIPLPSIGYVQ